MHDLVTQSAIALAAKIRDKVISSEELLNACFERTDHLNPALNAIVWQDREQALATARKCDQALARGDHFGPLHGLPITLKETFDLEGVRTTWGDPALLDNIAATDADVARAYKSAGAVIFGKTNIPTHLKEWQTFNPIYGSTLNPWDHARTPGGSSGGAVVALATGMSTLEAGSDIGSSIRNPAHYCGVFGLKPSWNVVSTEGHKHPGELWDTDIGVVGPLGRSAQDVALAFDLMVGPSRRLQNAWKVDCPDDPRDRLNQFRIAVKLNDKCCDVDTGYQNALLEFARSLEKAGATVHYDVEPDIDTKELLVVFATLLNAAKSVYVTPEELVVMEHERGLLEKIGMLDAWEYWHQGTTITHADWLRLSNRRWKLRKVFDDFLEQYDIFLTPVCASAAFLRDEVGQRWSRMIEINGRDLPEIRQTFWSGYPGVLHLPVMTGPAGFVNHLPVGYQAIAGHGRDRTALAFGACVEREIIGFTPPPGIN